MVVLVPALESVPTLSVGAPGRTVAGCPVEAGPVPLALIAATVYVLALPAGGVSSYVRGVTGSGPETLVEPRKTA